jgi:Inner membrane component of T3SS, cytoplasmic domain/Inner membrane component of T3SS, periplasmic domain
LEANAVTASTAHPAADLPPHGAQGQAGAQSAAPPQSKSAKLKFAVVAGTHEGAVLLLDRADYRIGSSPDADIVLSDEGVAPDHAVLHVGPGGVRIDATGGSVTIEHQSLALWRGRYVRLPANVTLGAARIHLAGDGGENLPRFDELGRELGRRALHNPLTAAAVLACLVIAVTVARELPQSARAGGEHSGAAEVGALERLTSGAANSPSAEAAARELSTRLDAANIRTLRVSTADGRVAVAGKVTKEEAVSWAAIQQWFDQAYGGGIVLTTDINPAGEGRAMPALQLQAIWYGENPYIVTAGGERYFEGAVLDNGWIIREIGEDRLLLGKGGETVALTYR